MNPNARAVAAQLVGPAATFYDTRASVACPLVPEIREHVAAGFAAVPRIKAVANRWTVNGQPIDLEVIQGTGGALALMHGLEGLFDGPPGEGA